MSVFDFFPYVLALYLTWAATLKGADLARGLSDHHLSGIENPRPLLNAVIWHIGLEEIPISILIAVSTSSSILTSRGQTTEGWVVFFIGVILFDLVRRLINRWKNQNPYETVKYLKLSFTRNAWVKMAGSLIILLSLLATVLV